MWHFSRWSRPPSASASLLGHVRDEEQGYYGFDSQVLVRMAQEEHFQVTPHIQGQNGSYCTGTWRGTPS